MFLAIYLAFFGQERWAVDRASLRPGERVLVVGHGPGVGLSLAAAAVGSSGRVIGVEPSETMRQMAMTRCAEEIAQGVVEIREGSAEATGCAEATADAVISVNNVMLWEMAEGFAELARILRPGGRLVVSVHRHVLGTPAGELQRQAVRAGLDQVVLTVRPRRMNSPAVELFASRPQT
jgi:arsenite methyltransferase